MKSLLKVSVITSLLAAAGISYAMGPMGGQCDMGPGMQGPGMQQGGRMDPARMQARMDQRQAVLKAQLKLTAAQEPALKPPASMMNRQRPDPVEMAKLSTPERIDKMKTLRAQHMSDMTAAMDQRGEATKAFYAVLTPEQQKVFDASAMRGPGGHHGRFQGPGNGPGP
ncbi:MAG: Spy/CpxP family protein refolding chaperone, partial [Rhodoferax sp.]|nr:Spy/CpxP family protein refolding chaperone [Rhodoferax sp.]